MVATVRNLTSASATSEYFRNEGGYYLEEGEGSEELKAKREEHREASAWHGKGAAALGLEPGKRVAAGKFEKLLQGFVLGTGTFVWGGCATASTSTVPVSTSRSRPRSRCRWRRCCRRRSARAATGR